MNATVDLPVPANRAPRDGCSVTEAGPNFGTHPAYFRERQQAAWEQSEKIPMPVRTDEHWRFADLKALDLSPFRRAETVAAADQSVLLGRSLGLAETSGRIVFANDRLVAQEFHGDALRAKGVIWMPLEQAIAHSPSINADRLIGFVFGHNLPSLQLFAKFGFARWGELPGVARLDGVERDVIILGRRAANSA